MAQSEASQVRMFGTTLADLQAGKPPFYSNGLYAMAILSDVQELLCAGNHVPLDRCRQWINRAKWFISQDLEGGRDETL
jgi:hypothetical protein